MRDITASLSTNNLVTMVRHTEFASPLTVFLGSNKNDDGILGHRVEQRHQCRLLLDQWAEKVVLQEGINCFISSSGSASLARQWHPY